MKEPKYTNWIEQYLEGELTPEEIVRFEAELAVNPDLREEYDLFSAIEEHFRMEADMEEMRNDPDLERVMKITETWFDDDAEEQSGNNKQNVKDKRQTLAIEDKDEKSADKEEASLPRRIRWIPAAATIAILISIFFIIARPPSPEKLFKHYYAELKSEDMGDENMPADVFSGLLKGIELFEANDYTNAISTFEALDSYKEQYPQISLFKGIVRLETGNYTLALEDFEECAQHESKWLIYAQRFRGICYLRLANPKLAAFYLLEKTGLSKNLDPAFHNLVRAINLITTGNWKEYRQMAHPGVSGPIILSTLDIVLGIIVIIILLLNIYCVIDVWMQKGRWQTKLKLSRKILLNPGIGAVIYLYQRRQNR